MSSGNGIADLVISKTPIAVFDCETTGLTPGLDRIIELSIVRCEPDGKRQVVLDTLVNPRRAVAATEIHGISDEDVADAPVFQELVGDVLGAVSDCVLASYNVYFDMRFLEHELMHAGYVGSTPHFCLMYMRPMLGLGKRCALDAACEAHGIEFCTHHVAAADTLAATQLLDVYLNTMQDRRVVTYRDLANLKSYKFVRSFEYDPVPASAAYSIPPSGRCKGRFVPGTPTESSATAHTQATAPRGEASPQQAQRSPATAASFRLEPAQLSTSSTRRDLGVYWEALKVAISDLDITQEETLDLRDLKRSLGLKNEQVRALHARAFASVIAHFVDDQWIDGQEREKLRMLYQCLSDLGWAPGQ